MTMIPFTLLFATSLLLQADDAAVTAGTDAPKEFVVERGENLAVLRLQRAEELVYRVLIDIGPINATVGTVTLRTSVEPFKQSVLLLGNDASDGGLETGCLSAHAEGSYAWYTLDTTIETRIFPQAWPHVAHRYESGGSERRRREVLLGIVDGEPTSSYRKDTEKNAPAGTRIWRRPRFRQVPDGAVDMLSALYLARTLVAERMQALEFPLIDKDELWLMRATLGREKKLRTEAGEFDVVEVRLEPKVYPGEEADEEHQERFEGLFGLHGSIDLWVDRSTGVPVKIQGDLPLGPITIGIDVELTSYRGTPQGFRPR